MEKGPITGEEPAVLAINPSNPSEMYMGSVSGGLYFSNNAGLSWKVNPQENLAVMSITYSTNGDILSTGEGL